MSDSIVGREARLLGDHPRSGQFGTIAEVTFLAGAPAVRITLDNPYLGECMAWSGDWELLP